MSDSIWINLLLWGACVGVFFYIRWRRAPHSIKTFQLLPDEEILWVEPYVEVTIQAQKKRYKTFDLTVTNQRLLLAQFRYYEEIWDYTHQEQPESIRFYGDYICIPKEEIEYEKTFRGIQTLTLKSSENKIYQLDLTDSEQNYQELFGTSLSDET